MCVSISVTSKGLGASGPHLNSVGLAQPPAPSPYMHVTMCPRLAVFLCSSRLQGRGPLRFQAQRPPQATSIIHPSNSGHLSLACTPSPIYLRHPLQLLQLGGLFQLLVKTGEGMLGMGKECWE